MQDGVSAYQRDSGTGKGQGEVIEEFSGRVITDPESPEYMGASVGSNNTAELTAIGHALRWALIDERGCTDNKVRFRICVKSHRWHWKPKANKELVRRIRSFERMPVEQDRHNRACQSTQRA